MCRSINEDGAAAAADDYALMGGTGTLTSSISVAVGRFFSFLVKAIFRNPWNLLDL